MNSNPSKALKHPRSDAPRKLSPKKKQLRFAHTSTLIVTLRKSNTKNADCWYSKEDILQFKKDNKDSAVAMASTDDSNVIKLIGYSAQEGTALPKAKLHEHTRGLEHIASKEVARILCKSQKRTIYRVIEEQRRQTSSGKYDTEKIAEVSLNNSRFSVAFRQLIAVVE